MNEDVKNFYENRITTVELVVATLVEKGSIGTSIETRDGIIKVYDWCHDSMASSDVYYGETIEELIAVMDWDWVNASADERSVFEARQDGLADRWDKVFTS